MATPYAKSPYFTTNNQYILYDIWVDIVSQDVVTNKSVIRVRVWAWRTNNYTTDGAGTCYVNVDGSNYSNSWEYGEKPIYYNSDTLLFDRNIEVNHNADGTKTIYASAYIRHARFSSNSQGFNVTLPTIPRQATVTNAPNFYDTDNPILQYSNPAGNVVTSLQACISLDGSTDNIAYRDISKTDTAYTFNLTTSERNTLLAACPNSNTLTVYFIIKTVLSGVTYYSSQAATMTVKDAEPTLTSVTYEDTNAATVAITGDNQKIIQANSLVRFNLAGIAAQKSATLSSVEITINAVTVTSSLSGSSVASKAVDFGAVNSSSNLNATVKVIDSRGNFVAATVALTMLAWSLPTAIISCQRQNNYYSETDLKVDARYSSLDGNNTILIQYQYKEVDGGTWSAPATLQDNVTETVTLDNTLQWELKVIVTDSIGSTTYNLTLDKGVPIAYFDRLLRSVGVECFPTDTESLEVERRIISKLGHTTFGTAYGGGSTGYLRIATVKFKNAASYSNAPIKFEVFRRGDLRSVNLWLRFANDSGNDPNINGLYYDTIVGATGFEAFAYKTATSAWDIYVKKFDSWDSIGVATTCPPYMCGKLDIEYNEDLLASKPAGATDAVLLT